MLHVDVLAGSEQLPQHRAGQPPPGQAHDGGRAAT